MILQLVAMAARVIVTRVVVARTRVVVLMGVITMRNMTIAQIPAHAPHDQVSSGLVCVAIGGVVAHLIQLPKRQRHQRRQRLQHPQRLLRARTRVIVVLMGVITTQNMTIAQTQAGARRAQVSLGLVCAVIGGVVAHQLIQRHKRHPQRLLRARTRVIVVLMGVITTQNMTIAQTQAGARRAQVSLGSVCAVIDGAAARRIVHINRAFHVVYSNWQVPSRYLPILL